MDEKPITTLYNFNGVKTGRFSSTTSPNEEYPTQEHTPGQIGRRHIAKKDQKVKNPRRIK